MLKRPSSRLPARTTRCVPGGRSAARPTTCSVKAEEARGVLAHDLASRLLRERELEHVLRVVEVVVGPVGGEHGAVLAVEEAEHVDDVLPPLGLLDRLGAVVELAHVAARAVLEQRHLAPPLEVLL